jgi:hypothetical protein
MALNSGKILMRRGQEVNFDPNKMTTGEWAVSLDSKYVRMCFSPGVCVRMATYDAFEADMVQIQRILEECQTIEEAVNRINDEISVKAQAVAEYTAQAKQYRDEAEQYRNEAFSSTPEGYLDLVEQVGENTRKIAEGVGGVSSYNDLENKPKINDVVLEGNKTLEELGIASAEKVEEIETELQETASKVNIIIENADLGFKETASGEYIHLDDSADSKIVEFGLCGKAVQNGEPTPQNPVEIEVAGSDGSVEVKSENEDGTKSKTATIPTPNGLAGIKVSSGGNYTDQNGQQWICDEIVKYADGSGAYIQRIAKKVFDGVNNVCIWVGTITGATETLKQMNLNPSNALPKGTGGIICDKFYVVDNWKGEGNTLAYMCRQSTSNGICCFYLKESDGITDIATANAWLQENNVTLYYILKEPITTPLTAEQLAEIEKLYTFYPVTNISNDFDCGMKVKYIADAKSYIDNRLALIEQAMLNSI